MTTYIFPGQGSQAQGMGKELFTEFPELVEKSNHILGYSLPELCLKDANGLLNKTSHTQPALYVVNALSYLKKTKDTQKKPDYVAGHSLGEYSALFAAHAFDFETGLKLVQKRGELMSQAIGGGMAAVIGLKKEDIQKLLLENQLTTLSIANYNSYLQVVISGPKETIEAAQAIFEKAGAMFFMLKVSGAFHSPYMMEAQKKYTEFLHTFHFSLPLIPVIANVNAKPYLTKEEIHTHLSDQITHSVRWAETIEYLLKQGESTFEEIGPGTVLMGLVRRIQKGQ